MKIFGHEVRVITDSLIYLEDSGEGVSVTNAIEDVVRQLHIKLGGIGKRRIFYRDSINQIDEVVCEDGEFSHFQDVPLDIIQTIRALLGKGNNGG